jgi:FAD/FMN-containing dehydrogenase
MMKAGWQQKLKQCLMESSLLWDQASLIKYSNDMHHLSPKLERLLKGKVADCIACPVDYTELDAIISVAVEYEVPLTPRGNGTTNYGQCVPLAGGIVVDFTKLDKIIEIGDGYMRVEPGANMAKMEIAARTTGQEMLMLPSTFKKSTIAGFIIGGYGGLGSVTWGTIWDGMVQSLTVKTIEPESKSFVVEGDDIRPYLHSYGTIGMVTEVRISLVPKVDWMQCAVSFESWESAAKFGFEIAEDPDIGKRLISVNEWPIPRYFTPLDLPNDRSVVIMEVDTRSVPAFLQAVKKWQGQVNITIPSEKYYEGMRLSDFSFGHYRVWVQKVDPIYANIQLNLERNRFIEQFNDIKADFPDLLVHMEIMKRDGSIHAMGTPIFRYESDERFERLKARCLEVGATVDDPHTYDLVDGGRAYYAEKLWEIKRMNDPLGLLNPNKLSPLQASS